MDFLKVASFKFWQMATYILLFSAYLFSPEARPIPPNANALFDNLKSTHPRLILNDSSIKILKVQVKNSLPLQLAINFMRKKADSIYALPVVPYVKSSGSILLVSRTILERIYLFAFFAHYDENQKYATRAWNELENASRFVDWNPSHFLDVAEMAHAFAIGYDWLYTFSTPDQRNTLRMAIKNKAFLPAIEEFNKPDFWVNSTSNWNVVCNSGLALAALAIGKEDTATQDVLQKALLSLQHSHALDAFSPDGAYAEGIGYWSYASQYLSILFASLKSALVEDFDLSQVAGLPETGFFPIYSEGPTGKMFNFGDAHEDKIYPFWMAGYALAYHQHLFSWFALKHLEPHVLNLLWYDSEAETVSPITLPLAKYFRGPELAIFRSAWLDSNASYLALKSSSVKNNHSHLDAGSFVYEASGVRWALDLGPDGYDLPNYFTDYFDSTTRFTYYRIRAEGHNTLTLNPNLKKDQSDGLESRIIHFDSTHQAAIGNITSAYQNEASEVLRGVSLQNGLSALIQDEVQLKTTGDVWWQMHTEALVSIAADGQSAILTQNKKRLWICLLSPSNNQVRFTSFAANPLSGTPNPSLQNKNSLVSVLALHITNSLKSTISIWLYPLQANEAPPQNRPVTLPLSSTNWPPPLSVNLPKKYSHAFSIQYQKENLYVTSNQTSEFQLKLFDLKGKELAKLVGRGKGLFIFPLSHSQQGLRIVKYQQNSFHQTLLINAQ